MLGVRGGGGQNNKNFFSKNLRENRVQFPRERNAFVLDHQHGRCDVRCKRVMVISNTCSSSEGPQ